ncbi:VQ motif-containing protein 1-like [Pistacia vera]|uniref:VQ motif-containing protein 1-like n=1 Tax=Pistacia vera TaxID=55513 RepID=UPI001263358A|nr:VQ motif-containing protein 1-like [Pistacia vera]
MSSGGERKPVKIVLINTQYVETDETSFKSVVQSLTGKDSRVEAEPTGTTMRRKREEEMVMKGGVKRVEMRRNNSILMRDLSFKEFDRLLEEMPPVDELYGMWAN